jgi:hypothetical protein
MSLYFGRIRRKSGGEVKEQKSGRGMTAWNAGTAGETADSSTVGERKFRRYNNNSLEC